MPHQRCDSGCLPHHREGLKAGSTVRIQHSDPAQLALLDELLWTKGQQQGFIPHEITAGRPDRRPWC